MAAVPDDMPPLGHTSITHVLGLHASTHFYDKTGKLLRAMSSDDPSQKNYHLRAERAKLRNWLCHNLNIEYGKHFQHFEEHETGVTAIFTDGTSAAGTILVGADGTSSTSKPVHFSIRLRSSTNFSVALFLPQFVNSSSLMACP